MGKVEPEHERCVIFRLALDTIYQMNPNQPARSYL